MNRLSNVSNPITWFWLALVVLLPVNLAGVVSSSWFCLPPKPIGDGVDYENIAFHLWRGRGFLLDTRDPDWRALYQQSEVTAEQYAFHLQSPLRSLRSTGRPPLLPLIIAACYRILDRGPIAFAAVRIIAGICLAVGGALATACTALLARRMFDQSSTFSRLQPSPTLVACGGCIVFSASNRTLRDYALDFLTEPLALLLMQLFITLCLLLMHPRITGKLQFRIAIFCGVVLGAMILTRSLFILWLPGLWLLLLVGLCGTRWQRVQLASIVVIAACCTCAPWWGRNCLVTQRWMPLGTQGPIALLGGYSDEARLHGGDWQFEPEKRLRKVLAEQAEFRQLPNDLQRELLVADTARIRVRQWITENLGAVPGLALQRAVTHWNPYTGRSLIWKLCILLGLLAIWIRARDTVWVFVGFPLLSSVVVAALYTTGGRFLVPLYGILFALAGLGVAYGYGFIVTHYWTKTAP